MKNEHKKLHENIDHLQDNLQQFKEELSQQITDIINQRIDEEINKLEETRKTIKQAKEVNEQENDVVWLSYLD